MAPSLFRREPGNWLFASPRPASSLPRRFSSGTGWRDSRKIGASRKTIDRLTTPTFRRANTSSASSPARTGGHGLRAARTYPSCSARTTIRRRLFPSWSRWSCAESCIGLHRARVRQLREREMKLVQLVDERTAELRQSRDQLEVRVEERTRDLVELNHSLEGEIITRTSRNERPKRPTAPRPNFSRT